MTLWIQIGEIANGYFGMQSQYFVKYVEKHQDKIRIDWGDYKKGGNYHSIYIDNDSIPTLCREIFHELIFGEGE